LTARLRSESAFTLVELLIVVLIIGVLIAVAAPSFLGQKGKADDAAAKQYLALTYRAAKAEAASNDGTYPADLLTRLRANAPETTFDTGTTCADATQTGDHVLYDTNSTGPNQYVAYSHSQTGKTFRIVAGASTGMKIDTVCDASVSSSGPSTLPSGPSPTVTPGGSQPQVGVPVTVDPGAWTSPDGNPVDVSEQWQRCDGTSCADITGATGLTYTPSPQDVGQDLRVVITATGDGGATSVNSDPLGPVLPAKPEISGQRPAISGSGAPQEGSAASSSNGDWAGATQTPTSYSYQWQSDSGSGWSDLATTSSYTPQAADVGATLRICVTAYNDGGQTTSCSDATDPVTPLPPRNSVLPSLTVSSGSPVNGALVTAQKGTWLSAVAVTYAYQWQRSADGVSFTDIPAAVDATYDLTDADYDQHVRVQVTATNSAGALLKSSPSLGPVSDHTPENTTAPAVSGSTVVAATLAATPGAWSSATTPTYSYQWQRAQGAGYVDIVGATAATYTSEAADVTHSLRVQVTAQNTAGTQTAASDPTPAISEPVPVNTTAPTVAGTTQEGALLTAGHGAWTSPTTVSYSYQWQTDAGAGWGDVPGETAATYTVKTADIDNRLRVQVMATNTAGPATASSAQTNVVVPAPATSTALPTITGTVREGQTVAATNGTWTSSRTLTYAYQWLSCNAAGLACTAISGENSQSYVVRAQDIDQTLEVQVTATNGGGQTAAFSAPSTLASAAAPQSTALPTVSGAAVEGQTLTVSNGTWTSSRAITYSYQWQYSSGGPYVDVAGETAATYLVKDTDVGLSFRARVTATNSGGATSAIAGAVGPVTALAPSATTPPSVSGTARESQTLTGDKGVWHSAVSVSYSYQWQSSAGAGYSDLAGAASLTYAVLQSDVGHTLRLKVTATNSAGATIATSSATTTVLETTPTSSAAPVVSGSAVEGQTLTVTNGSWAHTPASYSYQWQRSTTTGGVWQDIAGATTSSYVLQSSEVGFSVHVLVSACNTAGCAQTTSTQSGVTQALPPQNTAAPTVSGSYQDGATLTAAPGTWSSSQAITAYDYQWLRCVTSGSTCTVVGANQNTYTIQTNDIGSRLIVGVDATNVGGTSAMVYSSAQSGTAGVAGEPVAVISSVPVGAVVPYAGTTVPSGWLLADGSAVLRSANSELFAIEGTNYGAGDGSTTFNLPNLQGRFPLGKATSGTGSALGSSGGALNASGTVAVASLSSTFSWTDAPANPAFSAQSYTWWGGGPVSTPLYHWIGQYAAISPVTFTTTESGTVTGSARSASGTATVTAGYTSQNPAFATVRYIVKATATATAPSCALWGNAASSLPTGTQRADGTAASEALSSCLAAGYSGNLPDLRGAFPLGQALSGTGATLGASGGSLAQTDSVVLNTASTQATVPVSAYGLNLTISSPAPASLSYSSTLVQYGANGNPNDVPFTSACCASAGSDNGATVGANSSYSPGSLTANAAPAQTKTSNSYSAPYLTLDFAAYTAASYSPAVGAITPFAGPTAPSGWLLSDGACVSTTTYAALFAALGYSYGGSGSSFCLPNLSGRLPLGKTAAGGTATLGATGGSLASSSAATFDPWTPSLIIPAHAWSWTTPNHTYSLTGAPQIDGAQHQYCTSACYPGPPGEGYTNIPVRSGGVSTWPSVSGGAQVVSTTSGAQTVNASASGSQVVSLPAHTPPYQVFNYIIKY
jgi:prepilin-type N-terminal cleavage/methylation domain-containing protein